MANSVTAQFPSFIPGLRLIDGQDLTNFVNDVYSTASGIVAFPGGTLAAGTPRLSNNYNEIGTVATTNDSVVAPGTIIGGEFVVNNNGANTLTIFASTSNPGNGGAADGISASGSTTSATSITLASGKVSIFSCFKAGVWKQTLSA